MLVGPWTLPWDQKKKKKMQTQKHLYTNARLMREFVFCRIMKLNKWICAKKKANDLYFYKGHDEVKEDQPN